MSDLFHSYHIPSTHSRALPSRASKPRLRPPLNPDLNTVDRAVRSARSYSQEIRQDARARRIYQSFRALTDTEFEALLAFSIWKVRGQSLRFG